MFEYERVRLDFPFLQQQNIAPLIYFDNAATTQKPYRVLEALNSFYTNYNAPVYRGIYQRAEKTTQLYEAARAAVAQFIGAQADEIIFTRGTTESINFVATAWARETLQHGDEIVLTELEHHANLVPWQQVAAKTGATLTFIPVTPNGDLNYSQVNTVITSKTKIVAVTHCSNAVGTLVDIQPIVQAARQVGAYVLIDAAQTAPYGLVNVQDLACDFLAFSGHKMLGPTGIGVLYIKRALHDMLLPYQYGGGMVYNVDYKRSIFRNAPYKFEAGTPSTAQAIGLQAALEYLTHYNLDALQKHVALLCETAIAHLKRYSRVRVIGPQENLKRHGHLVSFVVDGIHAHDIAAYLDQHGVCVRAGTHCAQPLHQTLAIDSSVRLSFYIYNTLAEVEYVLDVLAPLLS